MSTERAEAIGVADILVRRSSLHESIARVPAGAVFVVMAPAGYGKSILARDWGTVVDQPSVVLAIHEIPPGELEGAIIAALSSLSSTRGDEPGPSGDAKADSDLDTTTPPVAPHATGVSQLTLDSALGLPFDGVVLVLDAADRLQSPAERELLHRLAVPARHGLTIVVTGRSLPVGISGAHGSRRLMVLDTEDLALTRLDIATAYRDSLTSTDVDEVVRLSGGWPLALPYALATIDPANGQAARERRLLTAYLKEEVSNLLAPRVREFLLDVAVLGSADADLMDGIRQSRDAEAILESLTLAPIPLVAVSGTEITMQPLVREFFVRQLATIAPHREIEVLSRAADRLQARGDSERAFATLERTGDRRLLAEFAYRAGRDLAYRGRIDTVRGWLTIFTGAELKTYPELQVLSMILDGAEGNFQAVAQWVAMLDGQDLGSVMADELATMVPTDVVRDVLLKRPPQTAAPIQASHATDAASATLQQGMVGSAAAGGMDLSGMASMSSGVGWWGIAGQVTDGFNAIATGDLVKAEGIFSAMEAFSRDLPLIEIWRTACLAYVYAVQGRPETGLPPLLAAKEVWDRAAELTNPVAIGLDAMLALCRSQVGQLDEAGESFDAAMAKLPQMQIVVPERTVFTEVALAEAAIHLGRKHVATDLLRGVVASPGAAEHSPFFVQRAQRLTLSLTEPTKEFDTVTLTPTETRILHLLGVDQPIADIARLLGRSQATVRTHVRGIYRKLGVNSREEALRVADGWGLLPPPTL